jgi:transcription initiation factor TFIIH subunit 3
VFLPPQLCSVNVGINKQVSVNPKLQPRILVIQRLLDNPAEYNSFMNCIFSAQKLHCLMDGLLLSSNSESSALQQACHLTGGTYSRYTVGNEFSQLLLVLLHKFLASACTRKFLAIPVQDTVSFKASCGCHQRPTEFAFVCTVCLSLTCEVPAVDKNGDRVCRACNTAVAAEASNPKQLK